MHNRQAASSTRLSLRHYLRRFAGLLRPPVRNKPSPRLKRKDALGQQHRSWRIKRFSQKVLLWLSLSAGFAGLGWLVFTLLLHSDIFRMTAVSIQGNQVTTEQQIRKAAGLHQGMNLLTIDVAQVASMIHREKWVEQVWVKRRWPSTVEIIVQEFKPFALINLEGNGTKQLYYMNDRGVVFAPSSAAKDLDYPVVNGSHLADDLEGERFRENSLGARALQFLKLTAGGNQILPTQAVSEINVEPESGLTVYLVDHPFPISMGKDKIRVRFNRLVKLLAQLYRDDTIKGVAEIRMDYADNKILVAMVDDES